MGYNLIKKLKTIEVTILTMFIMYILLFTLSYLYLLLYSYIDR